MNPALTAKTVAFTACLLLLSGGRSPLGWGQTPDFSDPLLEQIRTQSRVPALGAARVKSTQVESWVQGQRRFETQEQAQTQDAFHLGSCTKAMTATLVATFVEEGRLSWQTTLSEIYPTEFSTGRFQAAFAPVTLAMIGAHHSGLPGDLFQFGDGALWLLLWGYTPTPEQPLQVHRPDEVIPIRSEFTQSILSTPPVSPPGSRFEYSNANQIILGAIVEKISGKPWETLMKERILTPLKMSSCGFGNPAAQDLNAGDEPGTDPESARLRPPSGLWPHIWSEPKDSPESILPGIQSDNPPALGPAGTVHCSMEDWGKFAQLHLKGAQGTDTPILKAQSFVPLHTPYPGSDYTPGAWIRLDRDWANGAVLSHSGTNTFNYASVWIAPSIDQAFLGATNLGGDRASEAVDAVLTVLIEKAIP